MKRQALICVDMVRFGWDKANIADDGDKEIKSMNYSMGHENEDWKGHRFTGVHKLLVNYTLCQVDIITLDK